MGILGLCIVTACVESSTCLIVSTHTKAGSPYNTVCAIPGVEPTCVCVGMDLGSISWVSCVHMCHYCKQAFTACLW